MNKIKLSIEIDGGAGITLSSTLGPESTPYDMLARLESFIVPAATRALGMRTVEDEAQINERINEAATEIANRILEAAREADLEADGTITELSELPDGYLESLDQADLTIAAREEIERRAKAREDADKGEPYSAADLGMTDEEHAAFTRAIREDESSDESLLAALEALPEPDLTEAARKQITEGLTEINSDALNDMCGRFEIGSPEHVAVALELARRAEVKAAEADVVKGAIAKAKAERPDLEMEALPSAEGEVRVKVNRATRRRK